MRTANADKPTCEDDRLNPGGLVPVEETRRQRLVLRVEGRRSLPAVAALKNRSYYNSRNFNPSPFQSRDRKERSPVG
jgi:hypothetical protein